MIGSDLFAASMRGFRSAGLVALACAIGACASFNNQERPEAIGAAAGGAVGAGVGNDAGSTTRGVLIGAVVGGVAGALIGREMDEQARELAVAVPGAVVQRVGEGISVTFASGLLYSFDSDGIRSAADRDLQGLAASLKRYPDTRLLIVAHTDAAGATEYNESLSRRRADAALRYLVAQGVGPGRVQAIGRGEAEAVATNETRAGREVNRRIEMAIFTSRTARTVAR